MKTILLAAVLVLFASCEDHHGHDLHPEWTMEATVGEGFTKAMPIHMDDFIAAIDYSPVNFHAEAPVLKGNVIYRAFSLYSEGEQRVRTEVKCDTSKKATPGTAGEAQLSLLGATVKFSCSF